MYNLSPVTPSCSNISSESLSPGLGSAFRDSSSLESWRIEVSEHN